MNTLTLSALSYVGGGLFGTAMYIITLAFSRGNDPFSATSRAQEAETYKSFKDMFSTGWKTIKGVIHRNGLFVLRFSVFIAGFNFLMVNVLEYNIDTFHT
jgi:hypothetical protein